MTPFLKTFVNFMPMKVPVMLWTIKKGQNGHFDGLPQDIEAFPGKSSEKSLVKKLRPLTFAG
jgi:hypothetical protein